MLVFATGEKVVEFYATKKQVRQMVVNAINASSPSGLVAIEYEEKNYTTQDLKNGLDPRILDIDYFEGRCVKLGVERVNKGLVRSKWQFMHVFPGSRSTWTKKYPSYIALLASVGVRPS